MLESRVIVTRVERPYDEVYSFLLDPQNFLKWGPGLSGRFEQISDNEWIADTALGERIVRFATRNDFGVLDHAFYAPGTEPLITPMRAYRNGDGTDLVYTRWRLTGTDEARFESDIEWATADLLTLKTLLESL